MSSTVNPACQTIYAKNGEILFAGEWNPRAIYSLLPIDWNGLRVLDIGANTCGLSIEIARAGGKVTALEPAPYKNGIVLADNIIRDVIASESLDIQIHRKELYDADQFGRFDVVLCLGLIYHFRNPQYLLDFLSSINMKTLIISTQIHPGEELALVNRKGVLKRGHIDNAIPLSGWHPTRPLFKRMLQWAGFDEITALTDESISFPDRPVKDVPNSAYYMAVKIRTVDPVLENTRFYPR